MINLDDPVDGHTVFLGEWCHNDYDLQQIATTLRGIKGTSTSVRGTGRPGVYALYFTPTQDVMIAYWQERRQRRKEEDVPVSLNDDVE